MMIWMLRHLSMLGLVRRHDNALLLHRLVQTLLRTALPAVGQATALLDAQSLLNTTAVGDARPSR